MKFENIVFGKLVDDNSKCEHYNSDLDIVAIKLKCCNKYYACIFCHNEMENHQAVVWLKEEQNTKAIICGICKTEITINEYLECKNICPNCSGGFNPKCYNHYPYYFEQ